MAEEKMIEEQFSEMVKQKQERLQEMKAEGKTSLPEYQKLNEATERATDLLLQYQWTQDTDYSRDYQEIAADWSMSDGDKAGAYRKIENLINSKEERGLEIEKEMGAILKINKEVLSMPEQRNPEMKESLHPNTKASIEKNFGSIEFIHEEGRHAIVKGRDSGDYKSMRIENEPHGQRIYVKSGFPDYEQAMDQVNRDLKREQQPIQKIEQNPNQELSR